MPKICYVARDFSSDSVKLIEMANAIVAEYTAQGFQLTLRQLYYQFVARGYIPNNMQAYKRLGSIINDARLAGAVDWSAIEDRTRNLEALATWGSSTDILSAVAKQFRCDVWDAQDTYVEVWVEKDALTGVIEPMCNRYRVPYFACRGYTSQSEAWSAGRRFVEHTDAGQAVKVLHLGDHDPSGIDMTRDNAARLAMFTDSAEVEIIRLALNYEQIQQHNPPPNPTKLTDSCSASYVGKFGASSWELDALDPSVIAELLEANITNWIDPERWDAAMTREAAAKVRLQALARDWKDDE